MKMKRLIKQAALLVTAFFIIIGSCGEVEAAASSNTAADYKLSNLKLNYDSTTGQVKASWSRPKKETDVTVFLYWEDQLVSTTTVSGINADLTKDIREEGTGTYTCKAYPNKLGEDYTIESNELEITKERLKKVKEFDPTVYTLETATLSFDEKSKSVLASWQYTEKKSGVMLRLYKGSTVVQDWVSNTGLSRNLSTIVAKKGAGTYKLKVYPSKIGDTYMIESEEFTVTSDMVKSLKSRISAEQKTEEAKRTGWFHDGPTNVWKYYYQPGVLLKGQWLEYGGNSYHFSSAGIMQIGWQVIDKKYYYFDANGALVRNAKIGTEVQVNADGVRVDASGVPVSAEGEKEAPAIPVVLTSCAIRVTESGKEPGVVKSASFSASTGYTIESVTLSSEYPDWKAGVPVRVTLIVNASTNYSFGNGIKFTVSGCKSVSSTGGSSRRTVAFSYYPKKVLTTPELVYINGDNELCWKKVPDAYQYKVVFTKEGTKTTYPQSGSPELTVPKVSLSEFYEPGQENEEFSVSIISVAADGKSTYFKSSTLTIDKFVEYAPAYTIDGNLTFNAIGLKCTDASGETVVGWKQMFGYWYYFKKTGYAAGPGWVKDENELWYYFDSSYHMCTGKINDGTGEYFLNDGSVKNLPLGAWVQP